ncbi:UNVERIFIED_CONTAM: hypothetical protein Sradi_2514400 [Sesamum radiatum]|uniref:Uncharacterized protein n=1 Tax=Sesamum radiatum TaxID=300843 RepID=A0AAW2SK68_SESRA
MPRTIYSPTEDKKRRICEWIRVLKFSDEYISNLARCIDMKELRMHGLKSHDCHVFMWKLIQVAFHEILLEHVWSVNKLQDVNIIPDSMLDHARFQQITRIERWCSDHLVQSRENISSSFLRIQWST